MASYRISRDGPQGASLELGNLGACTLLWTVLPGLEHHHPKVHVQALKTVGKIYLSAWPTHQENHRRTYQPWLWSSGGPWWATPLEPMQQDLRQLTMRVMTRHCW